MTSLNETLLNRLRSIIPNQEGIELPPRIFLDMQGEFIAWDEDRQILGVRMPVLERYRNPLGMMQGGMIVAALDNAFGPLSYLVAPPSLTMQLNTSFIKGVGPDEAYIDIVAQVDQITRRFLFLSARVTNPVGELLALSQASCMILRGPRN
jgi:acyl-coenzyme A thioesterase PaaI-like protein